MADLRTDYKDDLLDTSVNTQRKYRQVDNGDGTVSFVDETVYAQNGDTFGASEVNQIHAAVNLVNDSLTVDTTNLSDDFTLNGLLQMLAEQYFTKGLYLYKQGNECTDITGGWTINGYTDGSKVISAFNKNAGSIELVPSDGDAYRKMLGTENAISLDGFSTLKIRTNITSSFGNGLWLRVSSSKDSYADNNVATTNVFTNGENVHSLDISSLTGSYFISITNASEDTRSATGSGIDIWLEY